MGCATVGFSLRAIAHPPRRCLVVVESFASPRDAARLRPVDLDPADLLRAFVRFRLLRFEDTDGISEWDPKPTSLVRMIAQKRR